MKKLSKIFISCLLALLLAILTPLGPVAKAAESSGANNSGKYVSEVRVGMGKNADEAAAALAGYRILSDSGSPVDLNQNAGGGWGSKGERVVYLGYKTTDDPGDAITDLAVMNMKGGYSVQDYEAMYDAYLDEQITPLINRLIDAIKEYRANFVSDNENNRLRAVYIHSILNKLIDDDTGKGLGDLLLNQTKYEMGDEAYEALSDIQKQNTADIVTILCQANGRATLLLENLLARAADTSDDTWLDRFAATTYDDMIDELCDEKGMLPSDAEKEAASLYEDDAMKIRAQWNDFYALLSGYNDAVELIDSYDAEAAESRAKELSEIIEGYEDGDQESEEMKKAVSELLEIQNRLVELINALKVVSIHDHLQDTEYDGGTLLDFFGRRSDTVSVQELYPIAASFSDGQKAGLDFISLSELIIIALTDGESYGDAELDKLEEVSVYEGVDRGIYEKGGVALTSEALRQEAMKNITEYTFYPGRYARGLRVFAVVFSVFLAGFAYTFGYSIRRVNYLQNHINNLNKDMEDVYILEMDLDDPALNSINKMDIELFDAQHLKKISGYMTLGLSIAVALLAAFSVYFTYQDLVNYYNVEFTPIPRYMVDEKDITAYNAKGEKIFIKNQTAYYKAAECNRTEADERYETLGTSADLGGDVGKQWLALYTLKNEAMSPILASSLKAVVDDDELPADYTTGIHMFGSKSALNLNSHLYVWNAEAPSVYVYFNVDSDVKRNAEGSVFADGSIALAGGLGILIGAIAVVSFMPLRKKKNKEEEAAE